MDRQTFPSAHARLILRTLLAGALVAGTLMLLPAPPPDAIGTALPRLGASAASAQGPADVDILLPEFSDLPLSVQPGQSFPLMATTAPGAQCVGHVTFRGLPTTDLDAQTASGGLCTWAVDVPPTARPGTAILK